MSKILFKAFVFVACFVSALWSFLSLSEAQEIWPNLGLYGGQIYEIAIDPVNPDKMFAGAYLGDGLFLTENGGKTWKPVLTGEEGGELDGEATFRNTAVWAVAMAPSNHNVVWATHDYWVEISRDGGKSWNHVYNRTMQRDCTGCSGEGDNFRYVKSLAVDPKNPLAAYVGTSGPGGSAQEGAIYKTTNGGVSWTKQGIVAPFNGSQCGYNVSLENEFCSTVMDIVTHPQDGQLLWALDYFGSLYFSSNGGSSWSKHHKVEAGIGETGLVVKPDEPNVLFIASYGGIVKVEYLKNWLTGQIDWRRPSRISYPIGWMQPGWRNVRALAFDPRYPKILFAALGEDNAYGFKLIKSTNGGETFDQIYSHELQFISLTVHPKDSDIIFGGELALGVYWGNPKDSAWTPINEGLSAFLVNDIAIDPYNHEHLLAATNSGVYQKWGRQAWVKTAKLTYTHAFSVAFDSRVQDGSSFYAGIEGYLAKTVNNGDTWLNSNYMGGWVNSIAIDPNDRSQLFVTTYNPGSVRKGRDSNNELNFSKVLPNSRTSITFDMNAVAIDPTDSKHVFAGGGNYFETNIPGKLFVSRDGGQNWAVSHAGVTVNALLIDPDDPNIIYSGCGYSGGTDVPLYKSTDGGQTWMPFYKGMPGAPTRYAIWGSSASDIFVLGYTGSVVQGGTSANRILQFDGNTWEFTGMGVSKRLRSLWGRSPSDIFAVGEGGIIVHFDGSQWTEMASGTTEDLLGVWGASEDYIFAVGRSGTILHYNGSKWSPMESKTTRDLSTVWGTDDHANVYAAGALGTILKYDQIAWSAMESGVEARLEGIWGTPLGSHIYAVGNSRWNKDHYEFTILHYDSNTGRWMPIKNLPPTSCLKLWDLWGSSWNDVYAVGEAGVILHFNGSNWSETATGTSLPLYAVWGASGNNVYAAGQYGTLLAKNASGWRTVGDSAEEVVLWNAVTDLELNKQADRSFIYASTSRQGIYVSDNQLAIWGSLLAPPHEVFALAVGSVDVATDGGAFKAGSLGMLTGSVKDDANRKPVDQVKISTGFGISDTTDADGEYSMRLDAGYYNLTSRHDNYATEYGKNVTVNGAGSCTYAHFYLNVADFDGDGISDAVENDSCLNAGDADTDDDGIADGDEDTNKNGVKDSGETDPCLLDTDNDGIQDGTERGYTIGVIDHTDTNIFQPDLDPSTKTNPLDNDSDNDGLLDGVEDLNHNGRIDAGETDPSFLKDRALSAILPLLLGD